MYIDLFDKDLPVLTHKVIRPGEQGYLYNVKRISGRAKAKVLCGASRIYDEKAGKRSYSFVAKSPLHTTNASRILLPKQPIRVCVNGKEEPQPRNCGKSVRDTRALSEASTTGPRRRASRY